MLKKLLILSGSLVALSCYADSSINTLYESGIDTVYSSNPQLNSIPASGGVVQQKLFKDGWYGKRADVTYMKLIHVGNDLGVSILYSETGYFCPVNKYLLFKKSAAKANTYAYQPWKQCIATITMNPQKNTFTMSVNSRTQCFEEPIYTEFCNGNENVHITDEAASRYFINQEFSYQKKQNDSNYNWDADQ